MLKRETARGYYVLVPSPFTKVGDFDEQRFRENVRRVCEYDIQGIVTTGTLGEFHTIRWTDHQRLIQALVDEVKQGISTVVGCSALNTEEAIAKTKFAEDCGADAALNAIPFYTKLTREECLKYWRDLSNSCPGIGLIVYNNPETTKFLIDAQLFQELSKLPNICGSKEIVGYTPLADFMHWMSITSATDLAYFCCDPIVPPAMMYGANGVTSENFALRPKLFIDVYKACVEGNWEKAKKLHREQLDFTDFVYKSFGFGKYTWFCVLKAALDAVGIIHGGYPRAPFIPVPGSLASEGKRAVLEKYGDVVGK
jgi:4-hydroxy-tetrahydrodipicolinate synthase